jgi:hypothetical protein
MMRRFTRPALALVVVAAVAAGALLLRGDGGRLAKPEYERKVQAVYADVRQAFRETNVQELSELPVRVQAAQGQLRKAADDLDGIEPPTAVAAENDQIVAGMRAYADDLDELRIAAELGDRGAIENFNANIAGNSAVQQIASAAQRMELKGYEIGALAGE